MDEYAKRKNMTVSALEKIIPNALAYDEAND